ncbi:DUF3306 domain-containing protein [Rhabdaerophilum calidifontis]|uniref:DUF3306 domain-containing protein n=1 Tax=Rhabdaerophilum calidifontis TaxID=2604328 RepID=UPI00140E50D4|nr:DUF3306 domain-containing protein [Rhabdaerophilum calidifontis]
MADEGGFLGRWSRRKRAAARPEAVEPALPAAVDAPAPADGMEAEAEPFDPASLPPVESLTAESDIRDFLRKEVPDALRNAALRRIWSEDPFIRSYIGPADYAWDFNDPAAIPGFGALETGFDLPSHLSRMTGAAPPPAPAGMEGVIEQESVLSGEAVTPAVPDMSGDPPPAEPALPVSSRPEDAPREPDPDAPELEIRKENQRQPVRRRHGGAVPV